MSNRVPVGNDLFHQTDVASFSCSATKDEVTLVLSQEMWEAADDLRSLHVVEANSYATHIRLPIESARELFNALGTVLGED